MDRHLQPALFIGEMRISQGSFRISSLLASGKMKRVLPTSPVRRFL